MDNQELIARFNPNNAANLGAEDLEIMRALTDAQIDVLADAYPNQPTRRAYLILYDQNLPDNKQLYQLSTWQNLRNVRKFSNRKNLIAFTFKQIFDRKAGQGAAGQTTMNKTSGAAKRVAVDLTPDQAKKELEDAFGKKEGSTQRQTITTGPSKQPAGGGQKGQPAKTTLRTSGKGKGATTNTAPPPPPDLNESPDIDESVPDDQQFINGE